LTSRQPITAPDGPEPVGPYSHAIRAGDLLFCSGMVGVDPSSGALVKAGAPEQARRALENLALVCTAAGARLEDAVRVTVYLEDMNDFAIVNEAYAEFFPADPPARVAIQAAALPLGATVEIDAVVALRD
jgi:2-iminobutanoate/2-iminopropanoate deaminase